MRPWAQKLLEHDRYPVATVVLSSDRAFLGMAAANDIMGAPQGMSRRYRELLRRGIPF